MKTIKNVMYALSVAFVMLMSADVSGQKVEEINLSDRIPEENFVGQDDKKLQIFTDSEKFKEFGAIVEIKGYVEDRFVKVNSIVIRGEDLTRFKEELLRLQMAGCVYTDCAMGCTDKPTMLGVALCTAYCMILCD